VSRLGLTDNLPATPEAGISRGFDAWRGREAGPASRPRILVAFAEVRQWRPWLHEASQLLDATEMVRVHRRRSSADRELLTLAYALHRAMLGAVLALHPRQVPLHRDARGCPRLAGDIACTSLSHADGAIAIAVARVPVGVDIEPCKRLDVMEEIASRIGHRCELEAIRNRDGCDRAAELLALWVRKEAVLKAEGVGFAVEPDSFSIRADNTARIPGAGNVHAVRLLAAGERWTAAVAGPPAMEVEYGWTGPEGVLRYQRVDLLAGAEVIEADAAGSRTTEWVA